MERWFILVGAFLMFLGVAAGAFGTHGLAGYFEQNPDLADTYGTAVRYLVYHALALFAVAWLVTIRPGAWTHAAGLLFITGVLIFSGSLFLLVFTRLSWLGAITPLGGVAFLAGWLCVLVVAIRW
jgi:uncharacterized membrane protein YgdD (TMEM256/DUF423 family)